ncbi:MAG: hypothetical protein J2P20_00070 [Pseudonocardia sp.]|nr:hypothetical protein [Pseudonocardia sp.]
MEILIVILLTWYGMGKYALHPTTRQRDKHRHQKYMERMRRRGGTPTLAEAISIRLAQRIATSGADHGIGRFFLEWWSDSWAYATERRRNRHARARAGELRRQKVARALGRLLGKGAKASGRATWKGAKAAGRSARTGAKAAGQRVRGRRGTAEGERQDDQTDKSDDPGDPEPVDNPEPAATDSRTDSQADPAGADTEPEPVQEQGDPEPVWADAEAEVIRSDGQPSGSEPVDAEVVDDDQHTTTKPVGDVPTATCVGCGAPFPIDGRTLHCSCTGCHQTFPTFDHYDAHRCPCGQHPGSGPQTPDPASGQHNHPAGRQLPAAANQRKEIAVSAPTTHNVTSGETVDPGAAKAFVGGVRGVADGLQREIEQSIASLRQRGVSGEPVAHLERMLEAATVLSGNSRAAETHFDRHINTQDQVLSDPTVAGTVQGGYLGNKS